MASKADEALEFSQVLILGALAYGAYLAYQALQNFFKSGPGAAPLQTAADAFVALTAGPAAVASGSAILPNGSTVPMSQVNVTNMSTNQATVNGQTYTLSEDGQGNFILQ